MNTTIQTDNTACYTLKVVFRAGEMAQRLRALIALRGPEFNSQQPHSGSQPSIMKSGALFWPAGIHAGRTLYT